MTQVGSDITAGGAFTSVSGGDTTLVASAVAANDEAYLYAGGHLNVLAAQDSDYSLYDMKKKGSFGSKKTKKGTDLISRLESCGKRGQIYFSRIESCSINKSFPFFQ